MKHLLVPTNLLDYAQNAAEYAIQFAATFEARITLMHSFHIPVVDPMVPSEYLTEMAETAEKRARKSMEEEIARLKSLYPDLDVDIDYHTCMGFAADEIVNLSKKMGVSAILMGTRHKDTLQRILVGSVMGNVLENAAMPVIVIPNEVAYKPITNIMFASEYNDSEDVQSIRKAINFVERLNATLYSVHVDTDEPDENEISRLDGIRELFHKEIDTGKLHFENIYDEDVVSALLNFSEHNEIDMMMMVTHKRSFFERLFDRSLSKTMAFRSDIPMIIFHK